MCCPIQFSLDHRPPVNAEGGIRRIRPSWTDPVQRGVGQQHRMASLAQPRFITHTLKPLNIPEKVISPLVMGKLITEGEGFPVVQFQAPGYVLQLDGDLLIRKVDVDVHLPMLDRHGVLQPDLTFRHGLVDMPCQGVLEVSFGVKHFSAFSQLRQKTPDVQHSDLCFAGCNAELIATGSCAYQYTHLACVFYGISGKNRVNFMPVFKIGARLLTFRAARITVISGRLKMGEAGGGRRRETAVASSSVTRRRLDGGRGAAGFQALALTRQAQCRIPIVIHALPRVGSAGGERGGPGC